MRSLLVLAFFGAIALGVYYFATRPEDHTPRQLVEMQVEAVIKQNRVKPDDVSLLKIQLALADFITRRGTPPLKLSQLVPDYFDKVPLNPVTGEAYLYERDGQKFRIGGQVTANEAVEVNNAGEGEVILAMAGAGKDFVNPNEMKEETFIYDPSGQRDPFLPFNLSQKVEFAGDTPLERYTLGQLRLASVLESASGEPTALVEDATGRGYMVKMGTRIGNNSGTVVEITRDSLKIVEETSDFTGKINRNVVEMKIMAKTAAETSVGRSRGRR
ncbi:MAG: pilus assembly protein PilP [bacterium]|nr:pilus assembly protein PilP [bacterium]